MRIDELIEAVGHAREPSGAEEKLVSCFAASRVACFGKDSSAIDAELIRQLCLHAGLVPGGAPAWLRIEGAKIARPLDLSGIRVDFPLRFRDCSLDRLDLTDSRLVSLEMHGGTCGAIIAGRVHVAHGVVLSE